MVPQDGGNSDFILTSPNGTIQSKSNLGNNRAGIQITNGMATPWGYFTGTISGSTNSIVANRDIRSNNGWIYGGNFSFLASKSWNAHGGTYNSTSLEQHLAWLYSLVSSAYGRADDAWNRANNAQTRADNAYSRANSAYNLASSANSNANNRVDWGSYNRHVHALSQPSQVTVISSVSKGTVSGERVVTDVDWQTYNTVRTGGPM